MYNITASAQELKDYYAGHETELPVYDEDYIKCIVRAIKRYYVDRNHPEEYGLTLFVTDEDEILYYDFDFNVVQEEYIFILAKLEFKRKERSDISGDGAISYTTNALSVTGAKEGYKSIQEEIDDLEHERRIVFHKMMALEEG